MSQQNIDFGSFPDDPDADAIRTAFQKVQTNFTELYSAATAGTVTSVSRGAGITVNSPTGNVIVTANLACLQVSTSSLSIGQGGNGSSNATISQTSQILVIDINPANVFSANFSGVSGALANLNGTLTSNSNSQPNITSLGTLANLAVTGNITGGNVYANSGTIGANLLTGTLTTAAQPNITSLGNLTNLTVTGNSNLGNVATANIFSGDGGLLTNVNVSAGSTILNGTSNVSVTLNGNVSAGVAGNANVFIITGSGINANGYLTASGNITGGNANLGNAVTASYFIGNLYGNANTATTADTVTTNAQPNITSVGNLSSLIVTADITAGNVYANSGVVKGQYLYGDGSNITNITITAGSSIVNGTSNVSIPAADGNVNTVVNGTTRLIATASGVNVVGTLNATGSITGNFGGNVTNATQANITSLGTLTGLTVNGLSNLGAVGNVTITGGTANYYLMTNGSGGLTWSDALLTPIPGTNTQVLFNDAGAANASSSLTFNKNTGNLSATLLTGTLTTATQTNITSVGTLGNLIVTSNLNAGFFKGEGGNISNIQGSNVSGAVGLATFATTANAVAGANVSGAVSFATTANAVAGANVSGAVSFATTANAVAGANVSGTVANATYATSAGSASTATSATTAGTVTTAAQPNITSVGTLTALTLTATTGTLTVPIITTGANTTAGTITGNWSLSAGSQLRATYADLAEYYAGDTNIEPGTVVEFGGTQEVQICNSYMSRLVAGIVTTNPAYVMNTDIDCEFPIAIALQGRIPAKVRGPVKRGDMMVSSNNGYAISSSSPTVGTVLGKALTDFNGETGVIEIMVGRT
jgi:hypothetical protein